MIFKHRDMSYVICVFLFFSEKFSIGHRRVAREYCIGISQLNANVFKTPLIMRQQQDFNDDVAPTF